MAKYTDTAYSFVDRQLESQRTIGLLEKLAREHPDDLQRRSIESMKWYVGRMRKLKVNTDKYYKQSKMERTRR